MTLRSRGTLFILWIGALALVACLTPVGTGTESRTVVATPNVRITESRTLVAGPTLELFWNLASLQFRDPSVASRLLSMDPRAPEETLDRLEIGFSNYRQQVAGETGMRSIILFMPHGADPVEEARRHAIAFNPWPQSAPPALLSGPQVDTLILFEPLSSARGGSAPAAPGRIASLTGLTGFSLAENKSDDPVDQRFYQVSPRDWKRSVPFKHTRCRSAGAERRDGTVLVTTLTYSGGVTDMRSTPLSAKSWKPCTLIDGVPGVTVDQASRDKAARPVIIAGSYFEDPYPGPLIAYWIQVK